MSQTLTNRQSQDRQDGINSYDKQQVFINNANRIAASNQQSIVPGLNPLSKNFFTGKLYSGSRNGISPSGAARFKRSAKKRSMAKARSSKR